MGSLKINRVSYFGNKYYYQSPELNDGINVITGDNGSGKSTFSFFIDYGLGGDVEHFKKNKDDKSKAKKKTIREYSFIVNDKDNYVLLDVFINNINYQFKRFINKNEIFINDGNNSFSRKLFRKGDIEIFSDWILSKLGIEVFDLTLGRHNWLIGFKDLYRLMYYDQETSPIKVFKSPSADNYISDSDVIRKAIFETLLGKTSEKYNQSYSEYRKAEIEYKKASNELNEICKLNNLSPESEYNLTELNKEIEELINTIALIEDERLLASRSKTELDINFELIEKLKDEHLNKSIELNECKLNKNKLLVEMSRIENFKQDLEFEIEQINKIIFTHDKLDIFSEITCPFCSKEIDKERQNLCLCGNHRDEENETKFIYSSSDYLYIHAQKSKKLTTVQDAINAVHNDIYESSIHIDKLILEIEAIVTELSNLIDVSTDEGNLAVLSQYNLHLNHLNDELCIKQRHYQSYVVIKELILAKESKNVTRESSLKEFKRQEAIFKKDNKKTIKEFATILKSLVDDSSLSCETMSIDDDYMPIIDGGIYREKSSAVTVRMMYYYTMLIYSLINTNVKFPKFLIMDTPEDSGIDKEKLIKNICLLDEKIKESNSQDVNYQVIITTGDDRCPESFEKYIVDIFKEKEKDYILKERI